MPPNMSVSRTTPLPSWTRATALENVGAALLHVVLGADRNRLELRLRPDDVLERGPKTSGELAVGHQDHSDHQQPIVSGAAAAPANRHSCKRRIFVQLRRNDQAKSAKRRRRPSGQPSKTFERRIGVIERTVRRDRARCGAAARREVRRICRRPRAFAAADRPRAGEIDDEPRDRAGLVSDASTTPSQRRSISPANRGAPRASRRPWQARTNTRSSPISAAKIAASRGAGDQRQRQRALARPGRAAHQHAALRRRRARWRAGSTSRRRRRRHGASAGRRMTKRAPAPWRVWPASSSPAPCAPPRAGAAGSTPISARRAPGRSDAISKVRARNSGRSPGSGGRCRSARKCARARAAGFPGRRRRS